MSDSDFWSASLRPQSPLMSILADRAAPAALGLVEIDQPVGHGLARQHLHLRIERGAHREPALVELLLSVIFEQVAANLLGEVFGGEDVGAGRPHRDVERLLLGLLAGVGGNEAVLDHAIDHVVAARDRFVAVAERIVVVRALGQRGEIGRLGDRQLVHRLVEIEQRRGGDAVGAQSEINLIEIKLEDPVLRIGPLDAQREQGFLDLAGDRQLVGQQEVLRHLLGDGRSALRPAAAAIILHVDHRGAADAGDVDAGVLVEVLVLGGDERVGDEFRHRLDRQIEASFVGVFRQQRAVGGVHPRHHRRFIILQLRVVRQVLGIMPHQAGNRGDAGEEKDGARREQKAEEPQQDFHYECPAPAEPVPGWLAPPCPASAPCRTISLNRPKAPLSIVCRRLVFCSN